MLSQPFVDIYIGRNGEFDIYAASVVKRIQGVTGKENNELICVMPYYVKDIEHYEKYYDRVIIPEIIEGAYPKEAITKRNKWMVEQAELFIGYIEKENGGAYKAMKYAESLGKKVINLARIDEND